MSVKLPRQHGAWAMLFVPFLLNVITGTPKWRHLLLLVAWILLYLATLPFFMVWKVTRNRKAYLKRFLQWFIPAIPVLIILLFLNWKLVWFGLGMLPFFFVNIYFAKTNNERAFWNNLAVIIIFCTGGLAAYFYGTGTVDRTAVHLFILNFLFFTGTTFYVKTMIRKKHNPQYKWYFWVYHVGVVILFLLLQKYWLALAFLPGAVRAVVFYGRKLSIKQIGIVEILHAVWFFVIIILAYG